MTLSISKLQNLLSSRGFIPNKYFTLDGFCFYIELFTVKTAEIFFLYIPSKYNFKVEEREVNVPVYKLKNIDMEEKSEIAEDYAGTPEETQLNYANNVQLSPDKNKLEEHLENNYNHSISLEDISKEDRVLLKALYRQMKRLRYSVQNLKYKLGVITKSYICVIRRDDSINCLQIKKYPSDKVKRLVVIADLETFYEKNDKILEDISKVKTSIYYILERNQNMHTEMIAKILSNQKDIQNIPLYTQQKKDNYDALIFQLESMLSDVMDEEEKILDKIRNLNSQTGLDIHNDINRIHLKTQYEKELDKISYLKAEITKNMYLLKNKRETAIIDIDKIMFDNTVMADAIINNFGKLREYC